MNIVHVRAVFGTALLLTTIAWAPQSHADLEADYERARELFNRGEIVDSMALLEQPVSMGHIPSKLLMATILDRAESNEEAIAIYQELAEKGDPVAQHSLGLMYQHGDGTEKKPKKALELYRAAVLQEHAQAMTTLGEAYYFGLLGLQADRGKGLELVEESKRLGFGPATLFLAKLRQMESEAAKETQKNVKSPPRQ